MFEFELARTNEWLTQHNRQLFIGIVVPQLLGPLQETNVKPQ